MQMCFNFADCGVKVKLMLPKRKNEIVSDPFNYYRLPANFTITNVPVFDAVDRRWPYGFLIVQFFYSIQLFFSRNLGDKKNVIIFSRDHFSALLLAWRGYKVFHDLHGFPDKNWWFWKIILKNMTGIITTNLWKKQQCMEKFNIPAKKFLVFPNGFDLQKFSNLPNKQDSRRKLSLPDSKSLAVYTGQLYDWKGANFLTKAAVQLPEVLFIFVGGDKSLVEDFKKSYKADNCIFLGHQPYYNIPLYLSAADVLVLPNSKHAKDKRFSIFSQYDTSPIKLFEYMSSKRPIIASNLPSILEILNKDNAIIFKADSTDSFIKNMRKLLKDNPLGQKVADRANQDVQQYSWKKRAIAILQFIEHHVEN